MVTTKDVLKSLIAANHVLHFNDVLDAYGHISVRKPDNSSTFLLSRDLAPALVSGAEDIVEYLVENAAAVAPNPPAGYIERFIHSEVYKRYPSVNSVIHSHTDSVIPFGVTQVPLLPVGQTGSVFGQSAPVFDIADYFLPTDSHALIIRNMRFGAALATYFGGSTPNGTTNGTVPVNNVVLMRGHGMTVIGPDIVTAVFRAVYTPGAANDQKDAIGLAAHGGPDGQSGGGGGPIRYLTGRELNDIIGIGTSFYSRAWELWVRQTEAAANKDIYKNTVGSPL
ncbi:class II aldolase and Adducin N-terminal domain-containing protein [Diaporthe sp. PMI_573]|nr:class II aldolase and Adducin N-terminal domain-containing protein [Diaporthaceae sp. PMI_573]